MRTPGPIVTPKPIETFGPSFKTNQLFETFKLEKIENISNNYCGCWINLCSWMNEHIANDLW